MLKSIKRYTTGALSAALLLGSSLAALAADTVSIRLDWAYGSEHAPIFLAIKKGFFADEGIEVKLMPGEGSSVTAKLVGNRDADFGYATADQILIAAQRGLPLLTTAVILQQNATALIFPKDKPIKDLKKDLAGKTVGVQLKSTTKLQWDKVKGDQKLDATTFKEVPADLAIVPLLSAGRIDAGIGYFFNDGLKARAAGMDVDWILFEDLGVKIYSTALFTNSEFAQKNPDLVRRFTRAFVKGWIYAKAHEPEALAAFIEANPETDKVYAKMKLPEVLRLTESEDVSKTTMGHSTPEGWNSLQETLLQMGVLPQKIDVGTIYTNDYLK
ncbi:ABC transporter substrate-binding protein [Ancylobacter oerskovii]|uniref:ABC transporter substrate-binding protein n=1 Tax=Ancylobacter oerskovii TaxID=459519 RepID=A0ABW4YUJ0_9HYPH|nr:ABC transporter substrate-binding protein [Ancylobacter oerskovii]MBS7544612.1 ABC transporter substrate-binding protein [Ancylobacter oerskovii]